MFWPILVVLQGLLSYLEIYNTFSFPVNKVFVIFIFRELMAQRDCASTQDFSLYP